MAERLLLSLSWQSSSLLFHIARSVCCSQLHDVMAGLGSSLQVNFLCVYGGDVYGRSGLREALV